MKVLKLTLIVAASLFVIGCSKGGLLTLERSIASMQQVSGAEFVSSSTAYEVTLGGYKVQQSVGDWLPILEQNSTSSGYKFYSTVQGVMLTQ